MRYFSRTQCVGGVGALLALAGTLACASSSQEVAVTPPSPSATAVSSAIAAPAASSVPTAPPEPTPEEKKRSADLSKLQEERAKLEAEHAKEVARFTPELRSAAQALADKKYATGHAAIAAVLASGHRVLGNADRDKYRHPLETLTFFGLKPTSTVLEYEPGAGWYTELLAPALAAQGKLVVTSADPNGPPEQRSTLFGQRLRSILDTSPELFGKVGVTVIDPKAPAVSAEYRFDLVLVIRELHNLVNSGQLTAWLGAFHKALKPGGVLGIEDHRAKPGVDPLESSKKGYVPEAWAIEQIEAAGFRLAARSEINANPKDTKDYPEGVWTLPPTYRLGEKDRAKYTAIGESDRMTLRFVKVEPRAKP